MMIVNDKMDKIVFDKMILVFHRMTLILDKMMLIFGKIVLTWMVYMMMTLVFDKMKVSPCDKMMVLDKVMALILGAVSRGLLKKFDELLSS